MNTPAKTSLENTEHDDFLTYPLHKVVSIFQDPSDVTMAVSELQANGYTDQDIEAFCSWEGVKRMDFDGARHGSWPKFIRAIQHVGPDRTYLERYEKHLRDGDCMVMVTAQKKERIEKAAEILHAAYKGACHVFRASHGRGDPKALVEFFKHFQ